jgi:hypothetical protein
LLAAGCWLLVAGGWCLVGCSKTGFAAFGNFGVRAGGAGIWRGMVGGSKSYGTGLAMEPGVGRRRWWGTGLGRANAVNRPWGRRQHTTISQISHLSKACGHLLPTSRPASRLGLRISGFVIDQGAMDAVVDAPGVKVGFQLRVDRLRKVVVKPCVLLLDLLRRQRFYRALN